MAKSVYAEWTLYFNKTTWKAILKKAKVKFIDNPSPAEDFTDEEINRINDVLLGAVKEKLGK